MCAFTRGGFRGLRSRCPEFLSSITNDQPFSLFLLRDCTSGQQNLFGKQAPTIGFTIPVTGEREIADMIIGRFGSAWNQNSTSLLWEERGEVTKLFTLPTGWFTSSYNDRHFLALYIQAIGDGDEGLSIQHYLKNPSSVQVVRGSSQYVTVLNQIGGQVLS